MALILPSRKPRLVRMYESAWNITEPVRPMSRVPAAERSRFYVDHDAMLEAFVARDADALVERARAHYVNLRDALGDLEGAWSTFFHS
jgi:DNA-binding GntR family transcriptional regulator